MPRPRPTWVYHFTHVDHLASIARDGLVCDDAAHTGDRLIHEVGDQRIKAARRSKAVTCGPGGFVSHYAPFYFAPRSPMLFRIAKGGVETYPNRQSGLIYLCTTLERVQESKLAWVASNRNARSRMATFTDDLEALEGHVDWPVMDWKAIGWAEWRRLCADDPEVPERRQAELLVHQRVPWEAVMFIGTRNDVDLAQVEGVLGSLEGHQPRRSVRGGWYF